MPTNEKSQFEYPEEGWSQGFMKRKGDPEGLITPSNFDLPQNQQGMPSVRIEENGQHILVPTMIGGDKAVSEDKAIAHFRKTGKHLGIFESQEYADKHAAELNRGKARDYLPNSPVSGNIEDRRADPAWQKSQERMPQGPRGKW